VECILANRNVTREFNCYCLVVEALPHESLWMVANLVEQAPADNPYTALKATLLSAHQQTDFQWAELLFRHAGIGKQEAFTADGCYAGGMSQRCRAMHCVSLPLSSLPSKGVAGFVG
jgi:hypothetical protein